jgi:hypothetical protein
MFLNGPFSAAGSGSYFAIGLYPDFTFSHSRAIFFYPPRQKRGRIKRKREMMEPIFFFPSAVVREGLLAASEEASYTPAAVVCEIGKRGDAQLGTYG